MNRIELHGVLRQYGTGFNMDVGNPIEAFRALDMQIPGFRKHFVEGQYVAIRDDGNGTFLCDEQLVKLMCYGSTIHFVPWMEGAARGKGAGKAILGVALFVGSMFIPGSIGFIAGMGLRTTGMVVGASLALAGASLLIAPQIKMDEDKENDQSFLYSGGYSSSGQDFAVPITYGRDRISPIIISSQIVTDRINVQPDKKYNGMADMIFSRMPWRNDDN